MYKFFATLTLYIRLPLAKGRAAKDPSVDAKRGALDDSVWPDEVRKINNNLTNQFASPILFYVCVGMLWGLGAVDMVAVVVAWVYVIARLIHMVVHTTSNIVKYRVTAFSISIASILVMLVLVAIAAAKSTL